MIFARQEQDILSVYRVRQKSGPLKFFAVFLSNRCKFQFEILQTNLLKSSTFNCQVKFDSVEKRKLQTF